MGHIIDFSRDNIYLLYTLASYLNSTNSLHATIPNQRKQGLFPMPHVIRPKGKFLVYVYTSSPNAQRHAIWITIQFPNTTQVSFQPIQKNNTITFSKANSAKAKIQRKICKLNSSNPKPMQISSQGTNKLLQVTISTKQNQSFMLHLHQIRLTKGFRKV